MADAVRLTVRVKASCGSAEKARALQEAVAADTPEFVSLATDGATLTISLTARTPASARATLEDLMACLAAADRLPAPGGSAADRRGERTDEER